MFYTIFDTPLCRIGLAGDGQGLRTVQLLTGEGKRGDWEPLPEWEENPEFFREAEEQIRQYVAGERRVFSLPLRPEGTAFQKRVWQALGEIPYGETRNYGQIAAEIGRPGAFRAVGAANGKNPLPLVIPCHRVIGSNGKLTGFAHGLAVKEKLLRLEGGAAGELFSLGGEAICRS